MVKYNIAIVGTTTRIGTEILEILESRDFPLGEIYALESEDCSSKRISFKEKNLAIANIKNFDFSKVDIAFFVAGTEIAKSYAEKAVKEGALVVDNSSFFKNDPLIPMLIPEINYNHLEMYKNKGIVVSPNCITVQMLLALAPIQREYNIKRVIAATYQSVSGAGNSGLEELFNQSRGIFLNDSITKTKNIFTKQIAFNLIPHIGDFLDNGNTIEEESLSFESNRILDSQINISATCVRVPVFIGHAMALSIELEDSFIEEQIIALLKNSENISVIDYRKDEGYVTPIEVAGEDKVYISRIRQDTNSNNLLHLWAVTDNLRKGTSLNIIQIAEAIINYK